VDFLLATMNFFVRYYV